MNTSPISRAAHHGFLDSIDAQIREAVTSNKTVTVETKKGEYRDVKVSPFGQGIFFLNNVTTKANVDRGDIIAIR